MSYTPKNYILARGNHSRWEDGVNTMYVPGQVIQIQSQAEYNRLRERLMDEAQVAEKVAAAKDVTPKAVVPDEGEPDEVPTDWTKVGDMHWAAAVSEIKTVEDLDTLSLILVEEQKARSRSAVIKAIEARMVEL